MSYKNKRKTCPPRAKVGLFVLTVLYTVLYNTVCHTQLTTHLDGGPDIRVHVWILAVSVELATFPKGGQGNTFNLLGKNIFSLKN